MSFTHNMLQEAHHLDAFGSVLWWLHHKLAQLFKNQSGASSSVQGFALFPTIQAWAWARPWTPLIVAGCGHELSNETWISWMIVTHSGRACDGDSGRTHVSNPGRSTPPRQVMKSPRWDTWIFVSRFNRIIECSHLEPMHINAFCRYKRCVVFWNKCHFL